MKFKGVENKERPFSLNHYSEEQKTIFKKRQESKDKATEFFTELYNQSVAWGIVANVMTTYITLNKKSAETFEQAWNELGYKVVSEIILRVLQNSPVNAKD
ncbi:phage protein [Streptococcus equinus]|uniref:hypothetical protein n=1 Tax=Streptococcus equinus TaxID=1335 RepID=UPI000F702434|nr:hypothetical protein [Streptococcus equinus]VED90898.1 phage protein [Streptococcus equinus]VTS83037.1 phage protein [Streptococcus equinus]